MKNWKRRITALFLTLTIVLSIVSVPAWAQEIKTQLDAATFLKDKGLLQGDEKGDLMLKSELTREQMMVIMSRLLGVEEEAKTFDTAEMTFEDVPVENDYAPYIAWSQANNITKGYSDEKFGFRDKLTVWQTKAFLLRALGYSDVEDDEIEARADEYGITKNLITVDAHKPILREDMALMMYNTLNASVAENQSGLLGEKLGIFESQNLEITASATSNKTIKVVFNKAVSDISKIIFELKGTSVIEAKAEWNAEKTQAILTAASVLVEGTYTLTASGDNFAEGKNTAQVVVFKSAVTKIEFVGDKLIKDASHDINFKAAFRYKIVDNYGADVTKNINETDLAVTSTKNLSSSNPFDIDAQNGLMTLNFTEKFSATDKIAAVTIVERTTGVSANSVLTISDFAKLDSVTTKSVAYPDATVTKLLTGKAIAGYILLDAKDQYGGAITSKVQVENDMLLVKSDTALGLTLEEYTDDANSKALRLAVNTTGVTAAKNISVTAVAKLQGKTSNIMLEIKEPSKADKITVGTQEKIFAAKDPAGTLVLPITVVDQYGAQLTADEIISNVDSGNMVISPVTSGLNVEVARTGDNKGKIVNKDANVNQGTYIFTLSTKTGAIQIATVIVKEQAYEKTIRVANTPATNMLTGAKTNISYKFIDQYDRELKNPSASDVTVEISNAKILKATVAGNSTSESTKVLVSKANVVSTENAVAVETVTDEGSAVVTAKLYKEGNVVSSAETTIKVIKGVPSSLQFDIADIPLLPARNADGAVNGTDVYARPIILTAKDASGAIYAIPNDRIMAVTTTNADLITVSSTSVSSATIKAQDGNYVVSAKAKASAFPSTSDPATKTAVIKIIISTDDGPKEITENVTVSKEDPKAVKVVFSNKDLKAGYPYVLEADAKEVTAITGTASEVAASKLYICEVDQYGVYTKMIPISFKVINIDKFTGALNYDAADNTLNFAASQIKKDEVVYIMYLTSNGIYNSFTIKVSDGTL